MTGVHFRVGCVMLLLLTLCNASVTEEEPCKESLLTDSVIIPDSSFSALSERMQDGTYSASRARLDNKYKIPWKAGKLDKNQYIQVDLGVPTIISGIQTQGCGIIGVCQEWVTKYRFLYSLDGKRWRTYGNSKTGQIIEFKGNVDAHKLVENTFSCPVIARYIRIMPSSWHNYISMKINLLGCPFNSGYIGPISKGNSTMNPTQPPLFHQPYPTINVGSNNSTSISLPVQYLTIGHSGSKHPNEKDCLGGLGKLSCWGMADGDYQHCVSCRSFIKCSNYNLFEFACPSKLLWDDNIKRCSFMSNTCSISI